MASRACDRFGVILQHGQGVAVEYQGVMFCGHVVEVVEPSRIAIDPNAQESPGYVRAVFEVRVPFLSNNPRCVALVAVAAQIACPFVDVTTLEGHRKQ